MNYQDHLTKFTILCPLKSKTAKEVAYQLMDMFCMFGAPFILQSDNGREFANKIVQILAEMWPGMKLMHGKPRQSQGSVERSNQEVRDMVVAWMSDTNTKTWSEELSLPKARKTKLCSQALRQVIVRLYLELHRGSDLWILPSLKTYSSI
jgi:IS30 family transposase